MKDFYRHKSFYKSFYRADEYKYYYVTILLEG